MPLFSRAAAATRQNEIRRARLIRALGKATTLCAVAWAWGTVSMTGVAHGRPITRAELCVTLGAVAALPDGRMSVTVPKMRAFVLPPTSPAADVRFTYNGPSIESIPLGSGQMRRQFGLKLRGQDNCNLVYVMWRIVPRAQLVVSIKRNPGKHTHAQCGTNGYLNLRPDRMTALPALRAGGSHGLRADIQDRTLRVLVDGAQAWVGNLGAQSQSFDGPIGVRSDNVNVTFAVDASVTAAPGNAIHSCPTGPVQED